MNFVLCKSLTIGFLMVLSSGGFCSELQTESLIHVPNLSDQDDIVLANGFEPHRAFRGSGYVIEPLHRVHGMSDYLAWHEDPMTFRSLKILFAEAWNGWPREEMTSSTNTHDLHRIHYMEFLGKNENNYSAYSYTVMDPMGLQVIGSLYIYPSRCHEEAQIFYWMIENKRKLLEKVFFDETAHWIKRNWPFKTFNYPGPTLSDSARGQRYVDMEKRICRQ